MRYVVDLTLKVLGWGGVVLPKALWSCCFET